VGLHDCNNRTVGRSGRGGPRADHLVTRLRQKADRAERFTARQSQAFQGVLLGLVYPCCVGSVTASCGTDDTFAACRLGGARGSRYPFSIGLFRFDAADIDAVSCLPLQQAQTRGAAPLGGAPPTAGPHSCVRGARRLWRGDVHGRQRPRGAPGVRGWCEGTGAAGGFQRSVAERWQRDREQRRGQPHPARSAVRGWWCMGGSPSQATHACAPSETSCACGVTASSSCVLTGAQRGKGSRYGHCSGLPSAAPLAFACNAPRAAFGAARGQRRGGMLAHRDDGMAGGRWSCHDRVVRACRAGPQVNVARARPRQQRHATCAQAAVRRARHRLA
jgi:hypothetical protein